MQSTSVAWNLPEDWGGRHESEGRLKGIRRDSAISVPWFPTAAMNWVQNNRHLFPHGLETRSPKTRWWAGPCSLCQLWGRMLPCFFWCFLAILGVPWLVDTPLRSHSHLLPVTASRCFSLCAPISLSRFPV